MKPGDLRHRAVIRDPITKRPVRLVATDMAMDSTDFLMCAHSESWGGGSSPDGQLELDLSVTPEQWDIIVAFELAEEPEVILV